MRCALRKLAAHICDCAAELDLQREPRLRLDKRGISGLLGDSFVKFPIAYRICFHIPALQGDQGFTEYIFKPPDVAVAHLRDGELDRETFKPLVEFVKVRRLVAGKAPHIKPAIRLDLDQSSLCQYPDRLAERGSAYPQLVDHLLFVHPSAARQFAGDDQAYDLLIDPFTQGSL